MTSAERLEARRLLSVSPIFDVSETNGDGPFASGGCPVCGGGGCRHLSTPSGLDYAACSFPESALLTAQSVGMSARVLEPLENTFQLHSLPSATKRIYLDFTGHVTSGTAWNDVLPGVEPITTPAYSLDGDFANFSDAELTIIQSVWARVAEDFIPFDVDVTTEEPPVDDLRNTGGSDDRWGMRVVIGGSGAWMPGAAGVALIGSFDWDADTCCFAFAGQAAWKSNVEFMATCISHETGHTLGLRHDGYGRSEYYGGRGSGATSWGPIMGNPNRPLTQWSNGDYGSSTNTQDDLAVMTGFGFGFRTDEHGNSIGTATTIDALEFTAAGIIGSRTDVDVFRFQAAGDLRISAQPLQAGANLDIIATLYDSNGTVIGTSNPDDSLDASFRTTVTAGFYYLAVDGTGYGNPNTTGYSDYGSLGQYTVRVQSNVYVTISDTAIVEGDDGSTLAELTIALTTASPQVVTVDYATNDGSAREAQGDYVKAFGTMRFQPGETQKTILIEVNGDNDIESDELFSVLLSNASGATLTDAVGIVAIVNDDFPPSILVNDIEVEEGTGGTTAATFTIELTAPQARGITVRYATVDRTATVRDKDYRSVTGTAFIPAGQTSVTVPVLITTDSKYEADEKFAFRIMSANGVPISRSIAHCTIVNDDPLPVPVVTISDVRLTEGNSSQKMFAFIVSLSERSPVEVNVGYQTTDITATGGLDYLPVSGTLRFMPGVMKRSITVWVKGDTTFEATEQFALNLVSTSGARLRRDSGIGTIVNDDKALAARRVTAGMFAALAAEESLAQRTARRR